MREEIRNKKQLQRVREKQEQGVRSVHGIDIRNFLRRAEFYMTDIRLAVFLTNLRFSVILFEISSRENSFSRGRNLFFKVDKFLYFYDVYQFYIFIFIFVF